MERIRKYRLSTKQRLRHAFEHRLRQKPVPHLPNEILLQILSHLDTPTLRYRCRYVSHFFKHASEAIIVERVLPDIPMVILDRSFLEFRACFMGYLNQRDLYNDVDLSMLSRKQRRKRLGMNWKRGRSEPISAPGVVFRMTRPSGTTEQGSIDAEMRDRGADFLKTAVDLLTREGCVCHMWRPTPEDVGQGIAARPPMLENGKKLHPEKVPGLCLVFCRRSLPPPETRDPVRCEARHYVKRGEYVLWYGVVEFYLRCLEGRKCRERVYTLTGSRTFKKMTGRSWWEKVLVKFLF